MTKGRSRLEFFDFFGRKSRHFRAAPFLWWDEVWEAPGPIFSTPEIWVGLRKTTAGYFDIREKGFQTWINISDTYHVEFAGALAFEMG